MKYIFVGVAVFLIISIYWNYQVYQKTQCLKEAIEPLYNACQAEEGCIIEVKRWKNYFKSSSCDSNSGYILDYSASKTSFELSWRIATGVNLVATGGRNKEIVIERTLD